MRPVLAAVLIVASAVTAQRRDNYNAPPWDPPPRLRLGMGWAGGELDHETDRSNLDDDAEAFMYRFQFEGTTRSGVGGGFRYEWMRSDDDLFQDAGFLATEATMHTFFGHYTYRIQTRRFVMPIRVGFMFNHYSLEEVSTSIDIDYDSIGPRFEIAPEFYLAGRRRVRWSIYGEFGIGIAGTGIQLDNDRNDYFSVTTMAGVELGTRLLLGPVDVGLAYVGRWQWMDESDPENGLVVLGYEANFQGLLFTVGVIF